MKTFSIFFPFFSSIEFIGKKYKSVIFHKIVGEQLFVTFGYFFGLIFWFWKNGEEKGTSEQKRIN